MWLERWSNGYMNVTQRDWKILATLVQRSVCVCVCVENFKQ